MRRQRKQGVLTCFVALLMAFFWVLPQGVFALQGADSYGYRYIDSNSIGGPEYAWEDIGKEGVDIGSKGLNLGFDNYEVKEGVYDPDKKNYLGSAVKIGFNFNFCGRTYSAVYLAGNGYITFSSPRNLNYVYDGSGIPSKSSQNDFIAPFWSWHDSFS